MTDRKTKAGHLGALITIIIWATTFISTKVLLLEFSPVEIMFYRFAIAYIVLLLIRPRFLKFRSWNEEGLFMAAGVCGVTAFYLFQNTALTYTLASNAAVLMSISPLFTGLISHYYLKTEQLKAKFFIGFAVSIIGIALIAFNGNYVLSLNPIGDLLCVVCGFIWAIYSLIIKKISAAGYDDILVTRKVFFYGLLFMMPILPLFDFRFGLSRFDSAPLVLNMLFLGIGASALCYMTWNYALKVLGAVRTSVYIYVIPGITIVFSALVLHETITPIAAAGIFFILFGLYLSEKKTVANQCTEG
jgi:drug/metabolite transporter (DMT)-like permease